MPFEPRKPPKEAAKEDDQVQRWGNRCQQFTKCLRPITQGRLSKVSIRSRSRLKSVPYVPYRTYEGGASPFQKNT
jgi:hypothetical protein